MQGPDGVLSYILRVGTDPRTYLVYAADLGYTELLNVLGGGKVRLFDAGGIWLIDENGSQVILDGAGNINLTTTGVAQYNNVELATVGDIADQAKTSDFAEISIAMVFSSAANSGVLTWDPGFGTNDYRWGVTGFSRGNTDILSDSFIVRARS